MNLDKVPKIVNFERKNVRPHLSGLVVFRVKYFDSDTTKLRLRNNPT